MSPRKPRSGAFFHLTEEAGPGCEAPVTSARYELLDSLGAGGMGEVYRAFDKVLRREVAYKTIRIDATEDLRLRLEQEARIAAQLQKVSGVVQIFDQGTGEDGRPFYVMELLDFPAFVGEDSQKREVVIQIARVVAAAHAAGVVHRDIKPSNVGLRDHEPVLADWGLATHYSKTPGPKSYDTLVTPHTRTGQVMGSMGFMAPEVLSGMPATPASDVWSLGCLWVHALELMATTGQHDVLGGVVQGALRLPKTPVGEVIGRALSITGEERYQHAGEFVAALEGAIAQEEVSPVVGGFRWPTLLAVAGLSLGLSAAGFWSVPNEEPFRATASMAMAEQGRLLYSQNKTLQSYTIARRSFDIEPNPVNRGLLMARQPPAPEMVETSCTFKALDRSASNYLCVQGDDVSLITYRGETLWSKTLLDVQGIQVERGVSLVHAGLVLYTIDADGEVLLSYKKALRLSEGWADEEHSLLRYGDEVFSVDHSTGEASLVKDNVERILGGFHGVDLFTGRNREIYGPNPDTVLTFPGDVHEPMVSVVSTPKGVLYFGMRGLVVEIQREPLQIIDSYRLPFPTVDVATYDEFTKEVVVGTSQGVYLLDRDQVLYQVQQEPARALSFQEGELLLVSANGDLKRWGPPKKEARHKLRVTGASITAFNKRGVSGLVVGAKELITVNIELMTKAGAVADNGSTQPYRNIFFTNSAMCFTRDGLWCYEEEQYKKKHDYHLANSLASGLIILSAYWSPGLAFLDGDKLSSAVDVPQFRQLEPTSDRSQMLGVTDDAELYLISEDHSLKKLPYTGVTRVLDTPKGLITSRGKELWLDDKLLFTLPRTGRFLAGNDEVFVSGDVRGEVRVFSYEGELLALIQAHEERISSLAIQDQWLFTGSWGPLLKRWDLSVLNEEPSR